MRQAYILEDDVIGLRYLDAGDVTEKYVQWLSDPDVNQYLETRFRPWSHADILEFVESKKDSFEEFLFGIFSKKNHSHIGNIKLGPVNFHHKRGDVSLFIGEKAYWGKGIARRAISLMADYAFSDKGINKLQAGAYENNIGSIKAFKNVGFVQEGLVEEYAISNGKSVGMVLLGMTRRQWLAGRK